MLGSNGLSDSLVAFRRLYLAIGCYLLIALGSAKHA